LPREWLDIVLDEGGPVQLLVLHNEVEWGWITGIDHERDLAIIECDLPPTVAPVKLAVTSPDVGEDVTIAGYGTGLWDWTYDEAKTKIVGKDDMRGHNLIRISAPTRPGDSGGPLIHGGELVGVHVKGDGRFGWQVPVEEVHEFLKEKAGWGRQK
jgi:S1-C subfamily serine protease